MGVDRWFEERWGQTSEPGKSMEYIWVKANPIVDDQASDRVALWDRDPRHPGGEIFIVATRYVNAPVQVYPTDNVLDALARGVLIRVPSMLEEERAQQQPPPARQVFTRSVPGSDTSYIDWAAFAEREPTTDEIRALAEELMSDVPLPDPPPQTRPKKEKPPWAKRKSRRIN